MSSFFAIGDVHGRYDLLTGLLKKWEADYRGHRLVFLGDYIDRGPDAFKVVSLVKELTEIQDAIALKGNHEDFALNYFQGKWFNKNDIWFYGGNGGQKTVASYGREMKLYGHGKFFEAFSRSYHADWMKALPLNYETDEVWFSHAPIPKKELIPFRSGKPVDYRIDNDSNVWTFHGNYGVKEGEEAMDHGKLAVCGHVHALREGILVPRVYRDPGKDYDKIVYADTGCGCWEGAPLTGIIVEDGVYKGYVQEKPRALASLPE